MHKELNQLIKDGIIISQEKKYLLNLTWVKEVSLFSDLSQVTFINVNLGYLEGDK